MAPPLVSVLMTVYNRESTVRTALESVLVQSFTDFELIVVDDCSQDRSAEVIRTLSDPRVRFFQNEKNLGDYPNRNEAARHARGTYLKYVDSDDLLYPHALAHFVAAMERHPGTALALGSQPRANWIFPLLLTPQQAYEEQFFGAKTIFSESSTSSFIRRGAFEKIGGFSGARHYGDNELWLKLAARTGVLLMGPGLVFCRRHQNSESGVRSTKASVFVNQQQMVQERLHSPDCPLSPEHKELGSRMARAVFLRRHFGWWRQGRKSFAFLLSIIRLFKPTLADIVTFFLIPRKPVLPERSGAHAQSQPDWYSYPSARTDFLR